VRTGTRREVTEDGDTNLSNPWPPALTEVQHEDHRNALDVKALRKTPGALWRKRKRATGPASAPKLRQNRIECSSPRFKYNDYCILNRGLPRSTIYDLSTERHPNLPSLLHPKLSKLQFSSSAPGRQHGKNSLSFLPFRSATRTREPPITERFNSSWPGSSAPGIRTSKTLSPSRSPHISKCCNSGPRRPLVRTDAADMLKRRLKQAGLPAHYSPDSFRATGITNFLENDGTLEAAQRIAGHADSRTTKLYDRRGQKVLLEDMERIRY